MQDSKCLQWFVWTSIDNYEHFPNIFRIVSIVIGIVSELQFGAEPVWYIHVYILNTQPLP